jgi:hypothetical protein
MQQDKEKVSPLLLAEFSPFRPPFNPWVVSASLGAPSPPHISPSLRSSAFSPSSSLLLFAIFLTTSSVMFAIRFSLSRASR